MLRKISVNIAYQMNNQCKSRKDADVYDDDLPEIDAKYSSLDHSNCKRRYAVCNYVDHKKTYSKGQEHVCGKGWIEFMCMGPGCKVL